MAETTTATSYPASTSRLTCRATLRMRSTVATDVPPNFMTRRGMVKWGRDEKIEKFAPSRREKARIHDGRAAPCQRAENISSSQESGPDDPRRIHDHRPGRG